MIKIKLNNSSWADVGMFVYVSASFFWAQKKNQAFSFCGLEIEECRETHMLVGLWLISLERFMSAGFTRLTIFVKSQVSWCCFSVLLEDGAHMMHMYWHWHSSWRTLGSRFWWALGIGTFQPAQNHALSLGTIQPGWKYTRHPYLHRSSSQHQHLLTLHLKSALFFFTFINLSSILPASLCHLYWWYDS